MKKLLGLSFALFIGISGFNSLVASSLELESCGQERPSNIFAVPQDQLQLVRESAAPEWLSLKTSRTLRSACQPFFGEEAGIALNNLFTNLAYEESLRLHEIHGDRFVEPLTDVMLKHVFFGLTEKVIVSASGLSAYKKVFELVTGQKVTAASVATEWAKTRLDKRFIDVITLGPVTRLINRKIVGPQVIAPCVAYGVHEAELGSLMQVQIFQRLCDTLDSYEDELVDREQRKLKQLRLDLEEARWKLDELRNNDLRNAKLKDLKTQIAEQNQRVAETQAVADKSVAEQRKKADEEYAEKQKEASWVGAVYNCGAWYLSSRESTPEELQLKIAKNELADLNDQFNSLIGEVEELEDLCADCEELISEQQTLLDEDSLRSVQAPNMLASLEEIDLLEKISIRNRSIRELLQPCQHIESGIFGQFLSHHSDKPGLALLWYLNRCGSIGPMLEVQNILTLDRIHDTVDETMSIVNNSIQTVQEMRNVKLQPTSEELAEMELIEAFQSRIIHGLNSATTLAHGTQNLMEYSEDITRPALDHIEAIKIQVQNALSGLQLALMPVRVISNTLKFKAILYVCNAFTLNLLGIEIPTNLLYTLLAALGNEGISNLYI